MRGVIAAVRVLLFLRNQILYLGVINAANPALIDQIDI